MITEWIFDNWVEIFGAITGILYVFLEIRQNSLLWPVGIVTSAVYVLVFFEGRLYADMMLQVYYIGISIAGWYWWRGAKGKACPDLSGGKGAKLGPTCREGEEQRGVELVVRHTGIKTGVRIAVAFTVIFITVWFLLDRFTNSPVPLADSFIGSLSVVATWMLARKLYEHWYLWILVNFFAAALFFTRGLYPTVVLYLIYGIMSFAGLWEWRKSLRA